MGNDLAQFQNRMTAENWEFLLTMLRKTTDKLLLKRKIDALLKDAKVEKKLQVEVFNPPMSGPSHVVLGRIRPADRRPKSNKKPNNNMAFNFGTGKAERGVVSPTMLETLPEAWNEESIKVAQENLIKLENESKLKPASSTPLDKKTEIIPPKPEHGEPWTSLNDWTVFGHIPNFNMEETRDAIAKLTDGFEKTQIDDRTFFIKKHMGIVGMILPDAASERALLNLDKKEEKSKKTSSSPVEGEPPASTTPETEVCGEENGTNKKRKRKYKKRTVQS